MDKITGLMRSDCGESFDFSVYNIKYILLLHLRAEPRKICKLFFK
jgi:hypothetical protein